MEKRRVMTLAVVVVFAMIFLAVTSRSQEDVTHVQDSAFGQRMRPPVPFAHDEHNEQAEIEDCNVCHHLYDENGQLVEDESSEDSECSECHASNEQSYPITLVQLYHNRCKGCHLEKKAGPVMCAECHPRR
ncbi:MAG: cytochrome c3 family protein [Deltaproteobacteria bacterium]|nr:cytochrome c3 family protein [Deltaproteobacteria bacterium]MBW1962794.1 cytochrome c3 family protein [Deltaproteobacteria bacterium]MBW2151676.1 cytochrome c3 family protein [Deltaproteobacteria bacterium]